MEVCRRIIQITKKKLFLQSILGKSYDKNLRNKVKLNWNRRLRYVFD